MHRKPFLRALSTAVSISLRQHLLQGGKTYGTMLMSDSPIVAEMMASMGYGFVMVDHEHSPTDVAKGQALLQAIRAAQTNTEPIVRVPSPHDPIYMKKVLDSLRLPGGVLIPMVDDAATAQAVVDSTRYPSQTADEDGIGGERRGGDAGGIRGCAVPFVRASGWGMEQDYMSTKCINDLLVMVQVETTKAVSNIEEIAAVQGIDMIFIGPLDLSCSIGKMGQFEDPEVIDLLTTAEERVRSSPALLGGFRSPGRELNEMFGGVGYSLVCGSVDMGLLREAARKDVAGGLEWALES
jgi:2-keto-3-deoxy-L-rhamnonate aldolase RhmA